MCTCVVVRQLETSSAHYYYDAQSLRELELRFEPSPELGLLKKTLL